MVARSSKSFISLWHSRYLEVEKRREAERAEDSARYALFVDTGKYISHDQMMTWLDGLAEAGAPGQAGRRNNT